MTTAASEHPRSRATYTTDRQTVARRVHNLLVAHFHDRDDDRDRDAHPLFDEEALAAEYDASRNAVREALQTLAAEGVLDRHPRTGTQLRGNYLHLAFDDAESSELPGVQQLVVDTDTMPVTPLLRRLLELPAEEEQVRIVENLFVSDGTVIGIRSAYYSTRHASEAYPLTASMPAVIADYFGTPLGGVRTYVGSVLADRRTARILHVRVHAPLVFRQQVFLDAGGVPIQVTFDHYRGDRVLLTDGLSEPPADSTIRTP